MRIARFDDRSSGGHKTWPVFPPPEYRKPALFFVPHLPVSWADRVCDYIRELSFSKLPVRCQLNSIMASRIVRQTLTANPSAPVPTPNAFGSRDPTCDTELSPGFWRHWVEKLGQFPNCPFQHVKSHLAVLSEAPDQRNTRNWWINSPSQARPLLFDTRYHTTVPLGF